MALLHPNYIYMTPVKTLGNDGEPTRRECRGLLLVPLSLDGLLHTPNTFLNMAKYHLAIPSNPPENSPASYPPLIDNANPSVVYCEKPCTVTQMHTPLVA